MYCVPNNETGRSLVLVGVTRKATLKRNQQQIIDSHSTKISKNNAHFHILVTPNLFGR